MKKILLTNHYDGTALELLKKAVNDEFELQVLEEATRDELLKYVGEADYLIVSGRLEIDKEVIDKASRLRMIQRTGVGIDNIDTRYLKEKNIPLYVNQGINSNSVAEYTIMLMLATLKRAFAINNQIRNGIWKKQETALQTHELKGKTIGLIGMGNIGKRVAELLKVFEVNVVYYSIVKPSVSEETRLNIRYVSLEQLFKESDIISLHCSYNKETGYVISKKESSLMKEGVVLVNTARGKLMDEKAVIKALEEGTVAGCGIDVFEEEPVRNSEYARFENVLLSPHVAGLSYETFSQMMNMAVYNISEFDKGNLSAVEECLYNG